MLESNASSPRSKRKLNQGVWQLGMIEDLISWKVELIYSSQGTFKAHHYFNYILLSENWSIISRILWSRYMIVSMFNLPIIRTFLFQIIIYITNPWLKEVWFDYALEGLQFILPFSAAMLPCRISWPQMAIWQMTITRKCIYCIALLLHCIIPLQSFVSIQNCYRAVL